MTFILLTGAGFSHNWGGWLAREVFDYLLDAGLSGELRALLWKSRNEGGGFEDVVAELQVGYQRDGDAHTRKQLGDLQGAVLAMFNRMDQVFAATEFEPQYARTSIEPRKADFVRTFLFKFDAIFTLNQDLLLEHKYLNGDINLQQTGRWRDWQLPGMTRLRTPPPSNAMPNPVSTFTPGDPSAFRVEPDRQPYFKLHGSGNWVDGCDEAPLLIIGGNKAAAIGQHPILKFYHETFKEYLSQPGSRLMVIGYSFGDPHMNDAIAAAIDRGPLRLFIVDPSGVDVIAKRNRGSAVGIPDVLLQKLTPRIIGASTRKLYSVFDTDRVEFSKLSRFFDPKTG